MARRKPAAAPPQQVAKDPATAWSQTPLDKMVRHDYGILLPQPSADWQVELSAFKVEWPPAYGGLGKFGHLERAANLLYPDLIWNDWLLRMWRAFCDDSYVVERTPDTVVRVIALAGVASASKTFCSTRFAFIWWLADAFNSIVILTSMSKINAGQRVWPVVQGSYHQARATLARRYKVPTEKVDLGNLVDSRKMLQCAPGNEARAIHVQAVKDGGVSKAEAFIRGQHAPRILVVIDEADETPEAIFSATSNIRKGCQDLTIIVASNPSSRLNPHGRCCEPRGGWGSRPPGAREWLTKGVPEWQIDPGICLLFNGADSPNVKAGRTIYPFLYTWEDYQNSLKPGVRNSLQYWKYDAGDWPPDGVCKTVFNDTMAVTYGLMEIKVVWLAAPVAVAFLDPGFGGDACVLRFGLLGLEAAAETSAGPVGPFPSPQPRSHQVLLSTEVLELELRADLQGPDGKLVDYEHQIASQVKAHCERRGCKPENFGLYSTGTGRGVASVLYTDWSGDIFKVEEGGTPSELPLSDEDPRPACDLCDRRVTELWWVARTMAEGRHLRGVDVATLQELCAREYELVGKPWKYRMETKEEFKPKLGHSPDKADALVGMCELVRVRHGLRGGRAPGGSAGPSSWEQSQARLAETFEGTYEAEEAWEEQEEVLW